MLFYMCSNYVFFSNWARRAFTLVAGGSCESCLTSLTGSGTTGLTGFCSTGGGAVKAGDDSCGDELCFLSASILRMILRTGGVVVSSLAGFGETGLTGSGTGLTG